MMTLSLVFEDLMLKAHRPPPATDGGPHFVFDGNVLTHHEFQYFLANVGEPVIVAGGALQEPNLVQLFDSRDAFEDWGHNTRFAFQFEMIEEIIRRHRYSQHTEEVRPAVGLISNTPLEQESSSIPVVWRQGDKSSASLFEGKNFGGREISVGTAAINDLADLDFSDTTSSATVRGVLMLSDRINFGGYRFYITGDPIVQVPDLKRWGFDKVARSAILI